MDLVALKKYRDFEDSNILYADLMKYSKNPVTNESRSTNAHETSHMISSQLRNKYRRNLNGFYYNGMSGILINQPNLTIKDVGPYIPENLRGYRYQLYFVDQLKHWNDSPLYIMEEWNCYSLGGAVSIVDYHQEKEVEKTDAVAGCFEFMIYTTALYMCIAHKDPGYLNHNENFCKFFNYLLGYSTTIYNFGKMIPAYKSEKSDKLYWEYQSSQEGKEFRSFTDDLLKVRWTLDKVF